VLTNRFDHFVDGIQKLLSPSSNDLLSKVRVLTSGIGVGYGFYVSQTTRNTTKNWPPGGGNEDWDHNAVLSWFPEEDAVGIVCSNSGNKLEGTTAIKLISDDIVRLLLDNKIDHAAKCSKKNPPILYCSLRDIFSFLDRLFRAE